MIQSHIPYKDLLINSDYTSQKDSRIKFLILHYTALPFDQSLEVLIHQKVSAHYLVPENATEGKLLIYRFVPDEERAWHAGESAWGGRTNLNDSSIGIEVVNRGYEAADCSWSPFTEFQREVLISLCGHLINTYKIKSQFVLGHSDIAPGRKIDPGPLFPWKELAEADIGLWPRSEDIQRIQAEYKGQGLDLKSLQKDLQRYGYNIRVTGTLDDQTRAIIQAFHMHFLGSDGSEPTLETHITLLALLKRVE